MKLYNSIGPNPRVVRMFMAERGIDMPRQEIDLRGGENRQDAYLAKNPFGQMPALELDDGTIVTEIIPICEYLDEIAPGASLIGATAQERAETRMWVRRLDLNIIEPLGCGFRFAEGLKLFQNRIHVIPQAAGDLKQIAQEWLRRLDAMMQGKTWICGPRFTLADIFLFCFLEFGDGVGQPLNRDNRNIAAWFDRVKARPSTTA
ncbi:MAG: glutathione S-transferase family protein [Rhodospirillales bacterium]|jgi:glutathione S-transferase|nr:glutathione S-transferase family protein [Rhodospirillales bacterium]